VVDTNCDPDLIDYIIPGNDDAIRAIKLFVSHIADACLEGQARREETGQAGKEAAESETGVKPEPAAEEAPETMEEPGVDMEEDFKVDLEEE